MTNSPALWSLVSGRGMRRGRFLGHTLSEMHLQAKVPVATQLRRGNPNADLVGPLHALELEASHQGGLQRGASSSAPGQRTCCDRSDDGGANAVIDIAQY